MGNNQPKRKLDPNKKMPAETKNQVHFDLILGSLGCFFLLGAINIL